MTCSSESRADAGWRASLDLGLRRARDSTRDRTILAHRRSHGPLQVQRAFHPGDGVCHLYLLHPPGGIVGGDTLAVSATLGEGARALLTTPAATKFYRSAGARATQTHHFRVAAGGVLEWLPQETIVFDGAIARRETRIELARAARCIAWDIVCLGRPAAGEAFAGGLFEQRLEVSREGLPLLIDRVRFDGGGEALRAKWGLGGRPVSGTMVCSDCDGEDLAAARALMTGLEAGELMAGTLVDGLLVVRFLGASAWKARERFIRLWAVLRPRRLGAAVCRPRIWNT